MRVVRFLSVEDVMAIHADTLQIEGGCSGMRDLGLLESAVMMPMQQFSGRYLHPDLASMAAAYLFHLVQNHSFIDGNKRVAAASMLVFLVSNGVEIPPEPEELEDKTLAVAAGRVGKAELTTWLRHALGDLGC
ncbi:death-on-curing family protein [Desulfocurvibacter africanus PCS]|uniref:Death-on-curing family protein n=1 Tax=Desulfocurvibacter africanus PCS TaxID=1262666 RepID=M5PQR9_DESAF|nr:type II toxin-antitoxin system death-on-curing family toxin [Desulfocurvibacter africanus]EMG36439.1 death-on-curing family protein [Desulfocurvibacter africanus PCS]